MAKKKGGGEAVFQVDCDSEDQWRNLCRRVGLIVVDVYAGFTGPCVSMVPVLKRIKAEINDDKLQFATACSDKIVELAAFKDHSEPIWVFLAGGKPTRVIRGCHVPNLTDAIRKDFEYELLCIDGKAMRTAINLSGEDEKPPESETPGLEGMTTEDEVESDMGG